MHLSYCNICIYIFYVILSSLKAFSHEDEIIQYFFE